MSLVNIRQHVLRFRFYSNILFLLFQLSLSTQELWFFEAGGGLFCKQPSTSTLFQGEIKLACKGHLGLEQ